MTPSSVATGPGRADGLRLRTFEGRAMGSPLRLTVPAAGLPSITPPGAAAWAVVRAEFEASEAAMSRFRDTSAVTELNRSAIDATPRPVSPRLRRALVACDRAWRLSDGRFDPRVLRDLERLGDVGATLPPDPSHRAFPRDGHGRFVDWQANGWARVAQPVDLGGIGKGLALRWTADALRQLGIDAFLLEAGGDLVTSGTPGDGGPWRVGLENPSGGDDPLAVIATSGEAVATSSIRRRRWRMGDRIVHHLIDPTSGEPGGAGLLAVTVAGPDPAWSEVWSKVLFLEGRAGIAASARRRGLAAWWIAEDGSIEMTAAARVRTLWVASEDG